ncbi:hypothetical protein K8I85_00510, partial [bacterium]|nr:hypothetical protein [bacterium]
WRDPVIPSRRWTATAAAAATGLAACATWASPHAAHAQATAEASIPPPDRRLSDRTVEFLFHNDAGVPVVHLDAAAIDSVGTAISSRNLALAWRVQRAYEEGRYGTPGEENARRDAMAAYIYQAETAFDFFLDLALQDEVIFSTTENDLKAAFTERFRNPGLYPIVNLKDARAGFGRYGMEFEVEDPTRREIKVTGETMSAWTEEAEIAGRKERVVNIDMTTMSHDRVRLVYRRYATGTVHDLEVQQEGTRLRVATMENVEGQFVRKWGLHRPTAVVLWKSRPEDLVAPPRDARRLGSAVYFPALELKLPWFLPDFGFGDLRRFDFPQPLLTLEDVLAIRDADLDWLRVKDNLRFAADWEGEGDVPEFVEERFPDR